MKQGRETVFMFDDTTQLLPIMLSKMYPNNGCTDSHSKEGK